MGSELERLGREPSEGKVTLDSSQFIDYVISKATNEAEARIHKKDTTRRTSERWILIAIAFIALSSITAIAFFAAQSFEHRQEAKISSSVASAMRIANANRDAAVRNSIEQAVERATKEKFNEKISALAKRLNAQISYQQLLALTTQLEIKDAFSDDDREQILKVLAELKENRAYESSPGFDRTLTKIVDSFTSAYQVAAVDRLDDMYRNQLAGLKDVPRWMTNHFGRALVTSRELGEPNSKRWERLRFYSDVTKQNRNPEISILWDILAEFTGNYERKTPQLDTLVAQIGNLNEKDREIFMRSLLEEGTASEREPPDMRRLAAIVTKFITEYKQELESFGLETE